MNTNIILILREIAEEKDNALSQRMLSERTGISLGKVNSLVKEALQAGLLSDTDGRHSVSNKGEEALAPYRVDNAVILAAGFGSRFVPFTYDTPKGLLKVNGQPMIERQIEQLHEAGIKDVTIVVGYLKEEFDYLIDKYGAALVFNPEYAVKNNFVSVYYSMDRMKNTYLLVSDHWIENSVFHKWEPHSWLCCSYFVGPTKEWGVTTGSKGRIVRIDKSGMDTWGLNGPAYFTKDVSEKYVKLVRETYEKPGTDDWYWEDILTENLKELEIYINRQHDDNVREFETLEELRKFDKSYERETDNAIMKKIAKTFGVPQAGITGIHPLKEGMTNQSFVFDVEGGSFVFRLPGAGTEDLISRKSERRNYKLINPMNIADEVVFFGRKSGVKISKFYEGARVCNAEDDGELKRAMELLKEIHAAGIEPKNRFDVAEMIAFYEGLAKGIDAIRFSDFEEVRKKADEILAFRAKLAVPEVLCHIDYVYANILWLPDGSARVIDWEYSGAADPITDVAMFSIYSYFSRERADLALSYYLGREPERTETTRLYMYMALAGFLWAIWCQYKQKLGEEFDEYPLVQYRYMKDFYRILKEEGYMDE